MPDLDQIIVKVTADVTEFRSQMKSAEGSLDSFGAKTKQTDAATSSLGAATTKAASSYKSYAQELQAGYGLTDQLSRSQVSVVRALEQQIAATKLSGVELAKYNALRKAGTSADSEAGRLIASLATAHYTLSGATKTGAAAVADYEAKSISMRQGLRVLKPIAEEAGASLGAFSGFAKAGSVGLGGLTVALGGALLLALENAADKARITKQRLEELFGAGTGAKTFDQIRDSARSAGIPVDALASSTETLGKALREAQAAGGWRFTANDAGAEAAGKLGKNALAAASALATLDKAMQADGLAAEAQKSALDSFANSIAKDGKLTKAAFDAIESASPKAAQILAQGFGFGATQIEQFRSRLDLVPPSLSEVLRALAKVKPEVDALEIKPTVAQSIDRLKASAEGLLDELAKGAGSTGLTGLIKDLSESMDKAAKDGSASSWARSIVDGAKSVYEWLDKAKSKFLELQNMGEGSKPLLDIGGTASAGNPIMQGGWDKYKNSSTEDLLNANRAASEGPQNFQAIAAQWAEQFANALGLAKLPTERISEAFDALGSDAQSAVSGLTAIDAPLESAAQTATTAAPQLGTLSQAEETLGSTAESAAGRIASAVASINASAANVASPSPPPDSGITADIGLAAAGTLQMIHGGGGTDAINLRGKVTSGEVVAVLPPGAAQQPGLLSMLASAIGSSAIQVTNRAIASPASFSAPASTSATSGLDAATMPNALANQFGGYFPLGRGYYYDFATHSIVSGGLNSGGGGHGRDKKDNVGNYYDTYNRGGDQGYGDKYYGSADSKYLGSGEGGGRAAGAGNLSRAASGGGSGLAGTILRRFAPGAGPDFSSRFGSAGQLFPGYGQDFASRFGSADQLFPDYGNDFASRYGSPDQLFPDYGQTGYDQAYFNDTFGSFSDSTNGYSGGGGGGGGGGGYGGSDYYAPSYDSSYDFSNYYPPGDYNAGAYATGGAFTVPHNVGSPGVDGVNVRMRMSRGEHAIIIPPGASSFDAGGFATGGMLSFGGSPSPVGGPSWWSSQAPTIGGGAWGGGGPSVSPSRVISRASGGGGDVHIEAVNIMTGSAIDTSVSRMALQRAFRGVLA